MTLKGCRPPPPPGERPRALPPLKIQRHPPHAGEWHTVIQAIRGQFIARLVVNSGRALPLALLPSLGAPGRQGARECQSRSSAWACGVNWAGAESSSDARRRNKGADEGPEAALKTERTRLAGEPELGRGPSRRRSLRRDAEPDTQLGGVRLGQKRRDRADRKASAQAWPPPPPRTTMSPRQPRAKG